MLVFAFNTDHILSEKESLAKHNLPHLQYSNPRFMACG